LILVLHVALIAAHAASGLVALAFGLSTLRPHPEQSPTPFRVYLGALWLMVLCLIAVVAVDWTTLDRTSRAVFGGLTLFALYIGGRGWSARRLLHRRPPGWAGAFVEDVGFTLIALFDGFVIVAALDLGAPVWLVVLVGALGVLAGRLGIGRTKQRVAA
jgi:hypothetical protein